MALIYGNKASDKLGFWMMISMIVFGIVLSQIVRLKFRYTVKKGKKPYDEFNEFNGNYVLSAISMHDHMWSLD